MPTPSKDNPVLLPMMSFIQAPLPTLPWIPGERVELEDTEKDEDSHLI